MKTAIFIRTAPYKYKQPERNLYKSLDLIGRQDAQPHISLPLSTEAHLKITAIRDIYHHAVTGKVVCSEFIRSQETAVLFHPAADVSPLLNEIRFSMDDFSRETELPGDTLDTSKMNIIRKNFSLALLRDGMQESQENILDRIREFAATVNMIEEASVLLCCSHGFIMKLFENFFRRRCAVARFQDIVLDHDWTKAPYGFLDGFMLNFSDLNDEGSYVRDLNELY